MALSDFTRQIFLIHFYKVLNLLVVHNEVLRRAVRGTRGDAESLATGNTVGSRSQNLHQLGVVFDNQATETATSVAVTGIGACSSSKPKNNTRALIDVPPIKVMSQYRFSLGLVRQVR